jgi:hypothetical protein
MSRPVIKGPVRATRSAFIVSRSVSYLSRGAEEALLGELEVISEGQERLVGAGERRYFGSTMITIDLERVQKRWRGQFDAVVVAELVRLVAGSVRVRLRATRIACAEAARRTSERPLGTAQVESHVRIHGRTLHIDVDLEVPVGVSSTVRRAP